MRALARLRPSKSYDKLLAKIGLSALWCFTLVLCLLLNLVPLRASESVSNIYVSYLDKTILYQGQYLDGETGLAYNRFRYYSPELGRYIPEEPIRSSSHRTKYISDKELDTKLVGALGANWRDFLYEYKK